MTIHDEHPFLPERGDRDPLRRFRGRMPSPVTVWTAGTGVARVGLTVSSVLVADGDPARVLGLVDEDSTFADDLPETFVVNLLAPAHAYLADAFAGTAPSPGGPFRQGTWRESEWGPTLDGAAGWLGARRHEEPRQVGWPLLVTAVVEQVELGEGEALGHLRGRYV
ncbi:flavin reductase [Nocardioides mangrovicus]|uniref:Flavin reductase n=1 Tax=Nocardioides mangrovicus TaxID=2478913 RepID=A0A3L8P1S1_9ACTN|nr:flavin reductase family protein [Nocardioides mangrovicus]RLV48892.1 flavin reductase [Nocardioides mangrovicus]